MSAVMPPPNAWHDMQSVRDIARRIGMAPGEAIKQFIRSGYDRTYLNELSERARRVRMAGGGNGDAA